MTTVLPISSPYVDAARLVTFRLHAPCASNVMLMGEFLKEASCLSKDASGVWTITIGPLDPEIYHYSFIVDGVRIIDPSNPLLKTGSTARTLASILEVRGDCTGLYDTARVNHGEIHTHWYYSESLRTTRRLTVYVPPEYAVSPRDYPVLYLLHGANGDENAWYRFGRLNLILDNMLARALITPFIVVMPFAYGVPPEVDEDHDRSTEMFRMDLLQDVIPMIDKRYRVARGAANRGLIGQSRGGGQALNIGLNHLDVFSYIGGFGSSHIGEPSQHAEKYEFLTTQPHTVNDVIRLLWIGCATTDCAQSSVFAAFLREHGIAHTFIRTDGGHTWSVWRRQLASVAPLLFSSAEQPNRGLHVKSSAFHSAGQL